MSFESYARHIAQKHRLAIALAVLRDKPESISIESYLEELQNKIIEDNADDAVTVCSDDFDLEDDHSNDNNDLSCKNYESNTLTLNTNKNSVSNNDSTFITDHTNDSHGSLSVLKSFPSNKIRNNDNQIFHENKKDNIHTNDVCNNDNNLSNIISNNDNNLSNIISNNDKLLINDTTTNSQESISILKNFASNDLVNNDTHKNAMKNTDRANLNCNNDKTINNVTTASSQESVSILNNLVNNNDDELNYNNASLNREKNVIVNNNNLNTHSVSIVNQEVIDRDMDFETLRIRNCNARRIQDENQTKTQPQIIDEAETYDLNSTYCNSQIYENAQNVYSNITHLIHNNTDQSNFNANKNTDSQPVDFDINAETQNYTHVSQSQNLDIEINEILFKKAKSTINEHYVSYQRKTNEGVTDNFDKYTQMEVDAQETYAYTQDMEQSLQKHQITQLNEDIRINEHSLQINEHSLQINEHSLQINEHSVQINEQTEDIINELNENSQAELIPFKVIEELNKVKSYLNKVVDRRISIDASSDSGYKSDSQSRSSFKNSSQSSVSFLNQSGHCLFNFISTAPVFINAQEIVNEIAQVLAQLVDRLHEEEKYLVFLDELLEKIDSLLQNVMTGSSDENMLLKKDEDIQRLLLLNISSNIQKYTINKIVTILEKVQNKLSNTEELYEISHTEECENLSYIFHILEVLLKRYIKKKNDNNTSLTPKSSQTDLKKSSITDIWKKKWNPNFKSQDLQEFTPKSCVLTKCSEILNKLVVLCMDGYSLISYAALQCFNVLQL